MYHLHKTTKIDCISTKDQTALSKAYQEATQSDFKTFKLGAVVRRSKVDV